MATLQKKGKKFKQKDEGKKKIKVVKRIPNKFISKNRPKKKLKGKNKVTDIGGMNIMNQVANTIHKGQRILPHWLSHPMVIKADVLENKKTVHFFKNILESQIIATLLKNQVDYLFPVQYSVANFILADDHHMESRYQPRDVCVAAPTGSGKTLTYILPIVQVLSRRNLVDIRALIILPVTELAGQVANEIKKYAEPFGLTVGSIYGTQSMSAEQDLMLQKTSHGYKSKVDILVCTPGRLAMHLSQTAGLDFSKLRFVVLDEADHLLTGDWSDTLSGILKCISLHQKTSAVNVLPPNLTSYSLHSAHTPHFTYPQASARKLLLSATLSHNPQQLRVVQLHNPILFATAASSGEVEPVITEGRTGEFVRPPNLVEEYAISLADSKALCLFRILLQENESQHLRALVFANTVEVVHRLSILLRFMAKDIFKVESFSSAIKQRRSVLNNFKTGKINVLISTDAMARGIDIDNIGCVISYEVVGSSTYTHRAGRTARAGKSGKSISIVTASEIGMFRKTLGRSFSKATEISLSEEAADAEKYKVAISKLSVKLEKEVQTGRSSKFSNLKQSNKTLRKFVSR